MKNRKNTPALFSLPKYGKQKQSARKHRGVSLGLARCFYCGDLLTLKQGPKMATWDHVNPISKGGSRNPCNQVIACMECNKIKGSNTEGWFEGCRAVKV